MHLAKYFTGAEKPVQSAVFPSAIEKKNSSYHLKVSKQLLKSSVIFVKPFRVTNFCKVSDRQLASYTDGKFKTKSFHSTHDSHHLSYRAYLLNEIDDYVDKQISVRDIGLFLFLSNSKTSAS